MAWSFYDAKLNMSQIPISRDRRGSRRLAAPLPANRVVAPAQATTGGGSSPSAAPALSATAAETEELPLHSTADYALAQAVCEQLQEEAAEDGRRLTRAQANRRRKQLRTWAAGQRGRQPGQRLYTRGQPQPQAQPARPPGLHLAKRDKAKDYARQQSADVFERVDSDSDSRLSTASVQLCRPSASAQVLFPRALQALPLGRLFDWTLPAPQTTRAAGGHSSSEDSFYGSDSFDDEGNLRRTRGEEEESTDETDPAKKLKEDGPRCYLALD